MDALPANRSWPPSCSHGIYQHEAITTRSRQLLMMSTWLPETCWATSRREIKNTKVTSSWFFYRHWITMHGRPHIRFTKLYTCTYNSSVSGLQRTYAISTININHEMLFTEKYRCWLCKSHETNIRNKWFQVFTAMLMNIKVFRDTTPRTFTMRY